jgi:hypothetical protein
VVIGRRRSATPARGPVPASRTPAG